MKSQSPPETFPSIGTADEPAFLMDQEGNLLLSYEIAPVEGGGSAILAFSGVIYFVQKIYPERGSTDEHKDLRYPWSPWDFTEVFGSDRTERWSNTHLQRRFWTISFNDTMLEIVFSDARLVCEDRESASATSALLSYLNSRK